MTMVVERLRVGVWIGRRWTRCSRVGKWMRLDETMKTKTNTMKPTHTPGPWTVDFDPDEFDSKQSKLRIIDGSEVSMGHPQGPLVLATLNVCAFAPHMDEPLANARLISCAPEMFEALVRLLLEVESICAHGAGETRDELLERLHMDWDGKLRAARMVITKAKGGEA